MNAAIYIWGDDGKCHRQEKYKDCPYSHNYNLSTENKKKVPKPHGLEDSKKRIQEGRRPYSPKPKAAMMVVNRRANEKAKARIRGSQA